jgi:hypothetical protein
MKSFVFALLAVLLMLAGSCSPFAALRGNPSPAEQLAELLAKYPELAKPETTFVTTPYAVPEVRFDTVLVPVHDTVYVKQEASQLDSLIDRLQGRLDSAQRVATRAQLHRLLTDRPVLRDTLRFDTLGVAGKFWRVGRGYHLQITRARITGSVARPVVQQKLLPAKQYAFYDPAGWGLPWWAWLLLGVVLGALLTCLAARLFFHLILRRSNA